jgi:hypothetical protein
LAADSSGLEHIDRSETGKLLNVTAILLSVHRQDNGKGAAAAGRALHVNKSPQGIHQPFDDGQSESGARDKPGFFIFDPVESLKNFLQMSSFDSEPIIR